MATFTKLLEISIVASSRSESSRSCRILLSAAHLPSSITLKSVGDKEKKAISEAETKAEQPKRTIEMNKAMKAAASGAVTLMPKKVSETN